MTVALGGLDAVAFSGWVGEHSAQVRAAVCAHLAFLGVAVDDARTRGRGEREISLRGARPRVVVVPAREECRDRARGARPRPLRRPRPPPSRRTYRATPRRRRVEPVVTTAAVVGAREEWRWTLQEPFDGGGAHHHGCVAGRRAADRHGVDDRRGRPPPAPDGRRRTVRHRRRGRRPPPGSPRATATRSGGSRPAVRSRSTTCRWQHARRIDARAGRDHLVREPGAWQHRRDHDARSPRRGAADQDSGGAADVRHGGA